MKIKQQPVSRWPEVVAVAWMAACGAYVLYTLYRAVAS